MRVKGARYSGCDVSFGKREKLLATGNRQVGWSSSGRTTSLILHLFHDITLHFSLTNNRKDISFKYKNKMGNYGCTLSVTQKSIEMWKTRSVVLHWWKVGIFWVTRKSFQQILLAQWYEYPDLTSWKCRMLPGTLWCQSNDSCLWANMPPSLVPMFHYPTHIGMM